jgi:hypothetical protein
MLDSSTAELVMRKTAIAHFIFRLLSSRDWWFASAQAVLARQRSPAKQSHPSSKCVARGAFAHEHRPLLNPVRKEVACEGLCGTSSEPNSPW